MSGPGLSQRIEWIEAGYEYLLAYAAQGRRDDSGSEVRRMLSQMQSALDGLGEEVTRTFAGRAKESAAFLEAVGHDARVASAAIALVLDRSAISSLLIDNLNASVHLRALLTDLFLIDQALKAAE
ncbi:MAG TPA: hypothetical protein VEZ88_03920 [Steroidobacteraceae bacterium]|nr:hypothetical protein [Steroidobacteraceae bacterium]